MPAHIIDGKAQAARLRATIAGDVAKLSGRGIKPGLAVVLVGNDPASQVYVRSKAKQTVEAGMASFEHRLPLDTPEAELLTLVAALNHNDAVDGILVQLPLPSHINADEVLRAIDPAKDVDGFHPINVGLVATGTGGIAPCTPLGSMMLLISVSRRAVGIECCDRRSLKYRRQADGSAAAQGGLHRHRGPFKNPGPPGAGATADILVAAVGRHEMIRGAWIEPGAIVIDVGINRVTDDAGGSRLAGDVAFMEAVHGRSHYSRPGWRRSDDDRLPAQ